MLLIPDIDIMNNFKPYTVARNTALHEGVSSCYKVAPGLDATGDEWAHSQPHGQWNGGNVLTFWAYDYEYPGTTTFYVIGDPRYHVQYGHRFLVFGGSIPYRTKKGKEAIALALYDGWLHHFSFWAFGQRFFGISFIHFKIVFCLICYSLPEDFLIKQLSILIYLSDWFK